MAQDLKISELAAKAFNVETSGTNVTVDNISQSGKYIVPAYIPGEGNKSIDIGLLFNIFKLYIDLAALQAVQNAIAQDYGSTPSGGDDGSGSGSGSGSGTDYTNLSNQINALRSAVYNPLNYPVTFLKLVGGSNAVTYLITTGLGQTSAYGPNNPIIINTTLVTPATFYVMVTPQTPTSNGARVTVPVKVEIFSKRDGATYAGNNGESPIGSIVITGTLTTSNGQYEASKTNGTLQSTTLNSSHSYEYITDYLEFDSGSASISLATVTCSIHDIPLGSYGTYISGNEMMGTGSGTVTINYGS